MDNPKEYASMVSRVMGTTIDSLLVLAGVLIAIRLLDVLNWNNAATILSTFFVFFIFYFTWPVSKFGFTPGYKILKIKIVKTNGAHLSMPSAFLRYVAKTFLGIITFITAFSEKRQCIHDKMFDSIVIKDN